jgi:hypothetical protein
MEVLMRSRFTFAIVAALVAIASIAYAKSIEDTLGGTIILTTKSIPSKLSSASSVKAMHTSKFSYEKEDKITVNTLIFLKKPLSSSGEMTIIDITDGLPGNTKVSDTFFTSDREQRIYSSPLIFDSKQLPGNRKYRVLLSYRGSVVAKGDFFIKAKSEKFDGKVEFTEEDTKKK